MTFPIALFCSGVKIWFEIEFKCMNLNLKLGSGFKEYCFPHVRTLAAHIALFPVAGTDSTKMVINAETQNIVGVLVEMPTVQALGAKFIWAMFNHVVRVELVSPVK
ncbi:hypothetical protein B0H13DRAFT_1893588 [Mycena leptocephala]|nr:hypothetical protein B0H13DRAFT_1893588 [Mycena leptocephala]